MSPIKPRTLLVGVTIYAAVFIVLGIVVNKYLFLPLIGLAFARPVLREFQTLADRDERQTLVSYRSSHFAFLVAMLIAGVAFLKAGIIDDGEPPQVATFILFVGLIVKFASLVLQGRGRRRAALGIGLVIGGAWLLFSLASHGFSASGLAESSIWIAVIVSACLGMRWPKLGGTLLLLAGLATLWFFVLAWSTWPDVNYPVLLLVSLPLTLAGILFLIGDPKEPAVDGDDEESRKDEWSRDLKGLLNG